MIALAAAGAAGASVLLSGRVVDEHEAPVAGARVLLSQGDRAPVSAYTDAGGVFRFALPAPGRYLLGAERTGYYRLEKRPVDVQPGGSQITLVLNPQREMFQSVEVGSSPSPVDPDQTGREQTLNGTEINDVPYPASHSLRNGMKLIPGVTQDPSGAVHFHGGAEYQTQYTLDGFDISDPISGRYATRLAVEDVRSLDLQSSRESAQFGRGSAGTLAIRTENGTDRFHYTSTNFVPGLSTHGGGVHLGNWSPRAGVSGPIVRGRAWFSDSLDGQFNSGYISGLPKGQDTNSAWAAGNLFHTQVNLTPANILYADVLGDFEHQNRFGLGVLDPVSTTTALRSSEWLAAVKDVHSWSSGALVEAGIAWQRVAHRRTPQGNALYILSPSGRQGNYFVDSTERGRRKQLFVNAFPRAFHFAGRHQLQTGADAQRLEYTADFRRSGYQVMGLSGLPLFDTVFTGSGNFERPDTAVAFYVNDHWQPGGRLAVDLGVRNDWDGLVGQAALAPRLALAWAPFSNARTKLTAGYSVIHDPVNLALFSRPLDQQALTTPYSPAGIPETSLVTTFVAGHGLRMPRYDLWSAGVQHDFGGRLAASAEWLRKRGRDGFVYAPEDGGGAILVQPQVLGYGFGGTYVLSNLRRDAYDEYAFTVRQSLGGQYAWLASYVRSRAISNAVLDVSVDQPLQLQENLGPMPWDAPNHVLSWGYLPLPPLGKNWAIAYLADWRSGFPFSITDPAGRVQGAVNSRRFPSNFDLNLHLERRFTFHDYRFALRAGFNNITDHRNPTAVNNIAGSPQYLQFFGDEGRHLVLRIRFFGRAR